MSFSQRSVCNCNKRILYNIVSVWTQANYNRSIVGLVTSQANTCAVAASGHEVELATSCGLTGDRIVLNGNGKQSWELSLAVRLRCLVNVDSVFDVRRLLAVCRNVCDVNTTPARILLRLNPAVDPVRRRRELSAKNYGKQEI